MKNLHACILILIFLMGNLASANGLGLTETIEAFKADIDLSKISKAIICAEEGDECISKRINVNDGKSTPYKTYDSEIKTLNRALDNADLFSFSQDEIMRIEGAIFNLEKNQMIAQTLQEIRKITKSKSISRDRMNEANSMLNKLKKLGTSLLIGDNQWAPSDKLKKEAETNATKIKTP